MEVKNLDSRILFVAFLCLLSVSMLYGITTSGMQARQETHADEPTHSSIVLSISDNDTQTDGGDPIGGGWPK
jgi:hypothetical protein